MIKLETKKIIKKYISIKLKQPIKKELGEKIQRINSIKIKQFIIKKEIFS